MNTTLVDVIIVDQFVEILWTGRNIPYYQGLGYVYTGWNDRFMVPVSDLPQKSSVRVRVKCPVCEKIRSIRYVDIFTTGHTKCNGCATIKNLSGSVFGKLTVLEIDREKSDKESAIHWLCRCQCGNITSVAGYSLKRKERSTKSCGCLNRGENHHCWSGLTNGQPPSRQYHSPEDKRYAREVKKRDNYTCVVCGKRGGKLETHHLYSHLDYPQYRLDIDYGRTVCKIEHAEFHSWMGGFRVPCTPEDFDKWMEIKKKA